MRIMKTSLMHYILAENYGGTAKSIESEFLEKIKEYYGAETVQKFESSGLYQREEAFGLSSLFLADFNLSFNIFETMTGTITEEELREYIAYYMKENDMWPTIKPIDEIARYSIDRALPKFVEAGLLEVQI